MISLSESQSRAVAHGEGPALVLAGPGSGKTLVITNRIQYLIEQKHVRPETILVITFTKAAAKQMRERFDAQSEEKHYRVNFGTFHAVFFQILKYAYHYTAENILREDQKYMLLSELADRAGLASEDERETSASLAAEISVLKNEQIALDHYYAHTCGDSAFRDIYRGYQKALEERHLIDFDDMLVYTYDLFQKRPDILAQWQKHFQWILIDEFQDINLLQYKIVKMLAAPDNHVFAVGDDDQSIYRFRGAKPEIMLGFQKDFPQASILRLHENFRCSGAITDAAGRLIRDNKNRYEKQIQCVSGAGESVEIRRLADQKTEALYIVRQVRQAVSAGRGYDQIAVLTRTNTGGRVIAERFSEFEIPFYMPDNVPNLYHHWIAQDIFSYIRLGMGIRDRKDFLRVMNRPLRYISRECVDAKEIDFERLRLWYEDKPWMVRRLDQLEEDLHLLGRMHPYAAVNFIRKGLSYDDYVKEYARQHKLPEEDLLGVADELQESAETFKTFRDWFAHIDSYSQQLEKAKQQAQKKAQDQPSVSIMTLHSSKGLEFEEVFLPDLNEDNIPHKKAVLEADLEEERRLLYVGMTRAKSKLHLLYTKERYGREQFPCRFLEALDVYE